MENGQRPAKRPKSMSPPVAIAEADLVNNLSPDCLRHVFSFLTQTSDRVSVASVSQSWFELQVMTQIIKLQKQNHDNNQNNVKASLHGLNIFDLSLCYMLLRLEENMSLMHISVVRSPMQMAQSDVYQVTDEGLGLIAIVCSKLKKIQLWNCPRIGNGALRDIASYCTMLEKLDLRDSPLINDDGLQQIAIRSTYLSSLSLSKCPQITDRSLEAMARHSTKLHSLLLSDLEQVKGMGVVQIIAERESLSELHIGFIKIEAHATCNTIKSYGREDVVVGLHAIEFDSCIGLTDEFFFMAVERDIFPALKKVSIKNCGRIVTENAVKCLSSWLFMLEDLLLEGFKEMTYCGITEILTNCCKNIVSFELVRCEFMKSLSLDPKQTSCSKLREIKLEQCRGINDVLLRWIGFSCKSIENLQFLRMDCIQDYEIRNLLQGQHSITEIDLTGCSEISDSSVCAIGELCGYHLDSLILRECSRLTDRATKMIKNFENLVMLDLGQTSVGDVGIRHLAGGRFTNLVRISLTGCQNITDKSLELLANCNEAFPKLKWLSVSSCPRVTDQGLELLHMFNLY